MASDPAVTRYLKEIGKIPLLTPVEEIELGHKVKRMLALKDVPDDQLTKADRRIIHIGRRAKKRMIEGNLRLVVNIAKKWNFGIHFTIMDVIQEGNIGLHRAVEKFDPERGYKFSTYAYWWIRQGIVRGLGDKDRTIRLPAASGDKMRAASKFAVEYKAKHGKMPSTEECAKHAKVSAESLELYLRHAGGVMSLDVSSVDRGKSGRDSTLLDGVIDDRSFDEEALAQSFDFDRLNAALMTLDREQQRVIKAVFPLDDSEPKSLHDLGQDVGLTRERMRQVKVTALNKLRVKMAGPA